MYQPYPSGAQMPDQPQRPVAPAPVQMAVKLMYAGAALSGISLILFLATISSLKSAIIKKYPHYTASHVHSLQNQEIIGAIIAGLIAIGLWIWMARANGAGKSWARILASVFFGLSTLQLLVSLAQPYAVLGLLFSLVVWLAGLGAIVLLWRKESGSYFAAVSANRQTTL